MKLRTYLDSDAAAVAAVAAAAHEVEPSFGSFSAASFADFTSLDFNRGARDFLVLQDGQAVVAFATSTLLPDEVPKRHFRIVVHPSYRRRGVATQLFHRIREQELPAGALYQASCQLSWAAGVAFIERLGFNAVERDLLMSRTQLVAPELREHDDACTFLQDRATSADSENWLSLHRTGYAGTPFYTELTPADLAVYRGAAGFSAYFASYHGRVVGMYHVRAADPEIAVLNSVVVDPAYRGRGLGRRLVRHALADSSARGFRRLELQVDALNAAAVGVYQSVGFRTDDEVRTYQLSNHAQCGSHRSKHAPGAPR